MRPRRSAARRDSGLRMPCTCSMHAIGDTPHPPTTRRSQGGRAHRARQHARELRRGAPPRRGHDRAGRAQRARRRQRPPARRPRLRGHGRADAAELRARRSSTSPASAFAGIELDVDVKLPGYELRVLERPARVRPGLRARSSAACSRPASTASARPSRRCASAGRCRACAATTRPTCSPRSRRWRCSPATARCSPAAPARR